MNFKEMRINSGEPIKRATRRLSKHTLKWGVLPLLVFMILSASARPAVAQVQITGGSAESAASGTTTLPPGETQRCEHGTNASPFDGRAASSNSWDSCVRNFPQNCELHQAYGIASVDAYVVASVEAGGGGLTGSAEAGGSPNNGNCTGLLSSVASGSGSFSVSVSFDSPTAVSVSGNLRGGGALSLGFPGVTLPPAGSVATFIVQPGAYTVSGSASWSGAGTGPNLGGSAAAFVSMGFRPLPRRPVLLIPGVGATYAADVNDIGAWSFTRGIGPEGLQIDPLAHAYDDLIQTLKNVGYVEGKDLFVVNYDWRLPPGPFDGSIDGVVSGITASSITDPTLEYAVDYLGLVLKQAVERWELDHPGLPLDEVDVIVHSTGGLVARTYVQSAAYGGTYTGTTRLPTFRNLIMVGVPNRGASKAWNPLHDNWGVDVTFQIVLSKIVNMTYQKVLAGAVVTGPDLDISLASISPPACVDGQEICFINQYIPTIRALLATYDFIDFGTGFTNVNNNPAQRNSLLLDLNAGLDLALVGDPNAFADKAKVTAIYGTNVNTPTAVQERVGEQGGQNAIAPFADFAARDALPGEVWYHDIVAPVSGDGTVPLDSSIGQFVGDARITPRPFGGVGHLDLMYNADVQKAVLQILGASFQESDISTDLHAAWASIGATAVNVAANIIGGNILGAIIDPVEGFVVDGAGHRLGFSTATGPLAEIPDSQWFGNANGLGWVFGPLQTPLTLQLTGLGGNFYTMVSVVSATEQGGLVDSGSLAQGEQRQLDVPTVPQAVDTDPPVVTPPANITIPATEAGGARGGASAALAAFLAGGSAVDIIDPAPVKLAPQVGGVNVDNNTLFALATTTVTFRFQDVSGNIGTATANVTVAVPKVGDLNLDGAVDCADLAIVKASFGKRCGQTGFEVRADLNNDCVINVRDLAMVSRQIPAGTRCP